MITVFVAPRTMLQLGKVLLYFIDLRMLML